MSDVGRYRIVYPRLWRHPGFLKLNKTAREITLYLLSGPQTNRIGLFHFSAATAAEDLNIGVETFRERLADVQGTFGWLFDADARVFYIPSWWRWNPPQNANVLIGNLKDLSEIAPCLLADRFAANFETLPERFHQTFLEGCDQRLPKRSPIQEQDQEQIKTKTRTGTPRRSRAGAENGSAPPEPLRNIAIEVVRSNPGGSTDSLLDEVLYLARAKGEFKRADAVAAINVAIASQRLAS